MARDSRKKMARKDHLPFVRVINDNPDDLTPRMVYADHLEETGLHHDRRTLKALRDPSPGAIRIAHFPATGKVIARKHQGGAMAETPFDPKVRQHHAEYLALEANHARASGDRAIAHQLSTAANFNFDLADHVRNGKELYFSNWHPSFIEESATDPDYRPTHADLHLFHRYHGFPEYPPDPTDGWFDEYHGGGQERFGDGSVLTYHSSGATSSGGEGSWNPIGYEDENQDEDDWGGDDEQEGAIR